MCVWAAILTILSAIGAAAPGRPPQVRLLWQAPAGCVVRDVAWLEGRRVVCLVDEATARSIVEVPSGRALLRWGTSARPGKPWPGRMVLRRSTLLARGRELYFTRGAAVVRARVGGAAPAAAARPRRVLDLAAVARSYHPRGYTAVTSNLLWAVTPRGRIVYVLGGALHGARARPPRTVTAVSPDGRYLVVRRRERPVEVWSVDPDRGTVRWHRPMPGAWPADRLTHLEMSGQDAICAGTSPGSAVVCYSDDRMYIEGANVVAVTRPGSKTLHRAVFPVGSAPVRLYATGWPAACRAGAVFGANLPWPPGRRAKEDDTDGQPSLAFWLRATSKVATPVWGRGVHAYAVSPDGARLAVARLNDATGREEVLVVPTPAGERVRRWR